MSRELGHLDLQPTPALDNAIAEAIALAERIMAKIDARSAGKPPEQRMTSNANYPWKAR